MKTKRQLFKGMFLLLGMSCLMACSEKTEDKGNTPAPPAGTSSLKVTPGKLNFTAEGGTLELKVTTTYDYYGYDFTSDWLSAGFKDDPTYNIITITAKPNTSPTARTATIKITGSNSQTSIDETVIINVEQEGDGGSDLEGNITTVTPKGGTIEEGDISITIPEGTFSSDTKIAVLEMPGGKTVGEKEITKFYKFTLPLSSNQPIKATIKSSETGNDVVFVAHAPTVSTHDVNQNTTYSDIVLPSTYSDGVYTAEIPAFNNSDETGNADITFGLARIPNNSSSTRAANMTRAVENGDINWTIEWWERGDDPNRNKIKADIDDAMRDAVRTIKGLGFKVKEHRIVPLIITSDGLDTGEYGQHQQSFVSDNWNSVKLNASLLFGSNYSNKALRQTMVHEMFHYFQSAYDPRGCFRKAKFGNKTVLRIMEAGGVWIEKFMDEKKMYDYKWDSNFQSLLTATLKEGAGESGGSEMKDAQAWGYGSALILEWFAKNKGDDAILKLYEAWHDKGVSNFEDWIKKGESATGLTFFDRYDDFVSMLAEGKLIAGLYNSENGDRYPYDVTYFNINNKVNITSVQTDIIKEKIYQYGVSGTRILVYNYANSSGDKSVKDKQLSITQKGDGVITKPYLYNVRNKTIKALDLVYSGKPLVISDESTLKDLVDKEKGDILYLVTECASNNNETEASEIEINMEEKENDNPMSLARGRLVEIEIENDNLLDTELSYYSSTGQWYSPNIEWSDYELEWSSDHDEEGNLVLKGKQVHKSESYIVSHPDYILEDEYKLPGDYTYENEMEMTFIADKKNNVIVLKNGWCRYHYKSNHNMYANNRTADRLVEYELRFSNVPSNETINDWKDPMGWGKGEVFFEPKGNGLEKGEIICTHFKRIRDTEPFERIDEKFTEGWKIKIEVDFGKNLNSRAR